MLIIMILLITIIVLEAAQAAASGFLKTRIRGRGFAQMGSHGSAIAGSNIIYQHSIM